MRLKLRKVKVDIHDTSLVMLVLSYIVIFSMLSLNKYHTYRTYGLDLGYFAQALWTTIHGDGVLYTTIALQIVGTTTHFGVHNSPILLLIVPIYYLLPKVETLLVLQSVVIGISAVPLYMLVADLTKSKKMALGMASFYLINSSVHGINLFDFHATPLAIPFIFLTAYFLEKAQYSKALITSTFILMTKEDAGIALISLGMFYMLKDYTDDTFSRIYNLLKRALRFNLTQLEKVSIWLILLGSTWSLLSLKVIVPYFAKGPHYTFTHYYTGSCINYLPHKVAYFLLINLTLGMLPFVLNFRYWFLLSFIPWVEILASCQINMFRIGFQYPYMLIPLSYIALSYGIKDLIMNNLPLRFKKIVYMGLTVGIIFSIMTTPALPPLIDTFNTPLIFRGSYEPITPHHKILSEIVNTLNNCSCSILTQNDIFPHLANRNNTYLIWSDMVDKNYTYLTDVLKIDIILIDSKLNYGKYNTILLPEDFKEHYVEVYKNDGIEIYVRKDKLDDIEIQEIIKKLKVL